MKNKLKTKKGSLMSCVDSVFVVYGEMIAGKGEDGYMYSLNDKCGLICAFDGCGGIGSRKYDVYDNRSGAYIASRILAKTTAGWFSDFSSKSGEISNNNIKSICDSLKSEFDAGLKNAEARVGTTMIKGSLTKSFPSTASMVFFSAENDGLNCAYVWAGDSRGYVLDRFGLCQITKDDIDESEDAMSNLTNDGRLTNVVSAAGDYVLNRKMIKCSEPTVLITASDGCFGYFSTPMEFEYMIVDTLLSSGSINEWKKRLENYIKHYAGDDYTFGVAVCGYGSFRELKNSFAERRKEMYAKYISRLEGSSQEEKIRLWNEYKKDYYRGV